MTTTFGKTLKKFIYGNIPYAWYKIFEPQYPLLNYYRYLKENGYTHYPYEFAEKYLHMPVEIKKDETNGLFYVKHRGGDKRLYYPRRYTKAAIEKNYRALLIEQDINHPHHYVDSFDELEGKILLDIGSAEGFTSLDGIEKIKFAYLFEFEQDWIEALQATFKPWTNKVLIVDKYVGKSSTEISVSLNDFFKDKPKDNLFLKMDIEGAECEALEGAELLFNEATNLHFAICTYHKRNDKKQIASYLEAHHCSYSVRKGFMYVKHRLRPAIIHGNKI